MNIDASKQSGQPDRDSSSLLNETLEQIPNVELLIGSLSCKQASWENVGPKHISGAMRQIVIDPTNRRRLYAVSANGGIWQLANIDKYPSTVWHPLTDGLRNSLTDLPASLHFRTMAVAPSNGQVLYAANAVKELRADSIRVYSEIYRSNTRGVSWRAIHQPKMGVVHRLVVHPAHPNIVFAATSTGLWRQDELFIGTWSNLFPKDCLDLALDPDDSSIMYLGVREQGIYKSFTSGSTWTNVPILDFDAAVAGSERQMIKISLGRYNSNATQQTPTTRTVVVRFGNEICVNQASGEGGAAAWQRATAASLDGGRTSRSDTNPPHNHEWYNCLAVDPFDPKHILIGASVLLESKNGGVSWSERALPHEDVHSLVFDQETPHLVYIANDGGLFSSIDGGTSWPSMRLSHTSPPSNVPSGSLTGSNGLPTDRGLNLAMGLITSEFVHAVVRAGRCVATIDHTGFILSEKFDNRWQFLFNSPDSSGRHGNHERGTIFTCPASLNRFYMFNLAPGDDPTNVSNRLAQFDFTHTDGFVNAPASPFNFLSPFRASFPVSDREENAVVYKPEHLVYNENFPGPFAARFSSTRKERLLLFGAAEPSRFTIQSLRLATDGLTVTASATEAVNTSEPFLAITFAPKTSDYAFAMTQSGKLFERDFSVAGQFTAVSQWAIPGHDLFVSRLIVGPPPDPSLYALSQHAIGRFSHKTRAWTTVQVWDKPKQSLMSLIAHPTREDTLFLGTNFGVYMSENGGTSWNEYQLDMPAVPITELSFDQGYLYAATFGRGLWRCKPCPG